MGAASPAWFEWPEVYDAGDVLPAGDDLDETHRRVSEASAALASAGLYPCGFGGGHDLTFAFVRGVIDGLPDDEKPRMGVYLDPHLDVRETRGSGMPFRRLIEECGVQALHCTGFEPSVNDGEHWAWFNEHGGLRTDLDTPSPEQPFFASLDLDVLDAAFAPGVSAMNPSGLHANECSYWLGQMAKSDWCRCFDIMELSPPHDDRDRTARVAAYLFQQALWSIARADVTRSFLP